VDEVGGGSVVGWGGGGWGRKGVEVWGGGGGGSRLGVGGERWEGGEGGCVGEVGRRIVMESIRNRCVRDLT